MLEDAILILGIALCTALLSEGTSDSVAPLSHVLTCLVATPPPPGLLYVAVYRSDHYKKLKVTVEKQSKQCEGVRVYLCESVEVCLCEGVHVCECGGIP